MSVDNAAEDCEALSAPPALSTASTATSTDSAINEWPLSPPGIAKIAPFLYVSHLLSAWNSRLFEFGAFLFLATIYPQTLLPASVYAMVRALAAVSLAPDIGRFIDRSERLHTVRLSILGQRVAVAFSCAIFFALVRSDSVRLSSVWSFGALAVLSVLACVEKLSAIMNTISVEREWVVIIARGDGNNLRTMNSQMRRIDLFCKLIAPLLIAFVDSASTKLAIILTAALNSFSVVVEYLAIAHVYQIATDLGEPKVADSAAGIRDTQSMYGRLRKAFEGLRVYLQHPTFMPSFSLALLYLTVLSFGGQMTTFLLAIGIESSTIGILRGLSAICELSATWIAPRVMKYIGPVRSGIWFINWQIFCVGIACACLWLDFSPFATTVGAVAAVVASRVGLWGFDLSAQIVIQEEVDAASRGTFSSMEFAFQNAFEMLSFASTIIFAKPMQFKWPATISALAVATAGIIYAAFVRERRGHLVHLSDCIDRRSKIQGFIRPDGWQQIPQDDGAGRRDFELQTVPVGMHRGPLT